MKRLLVDMDDVIADTSGAILDLYNEEFDTQYSKGDFWNNQLWESEVSTAYLTIRHKLFEEGFFRNLGVMDGAKVAMEKLNDKYELFIVSAATEFPNSLKEKIDWLQEHFPYIHWKNIILCGDKSPVQGDYLIDDREKNFINFKGEPLLFHAIHNQQLEGYKRVKTWEEIAGILL